MRAILHLIVIFGWPLIILESLKEYKKERTKKNLFFLILSLLVYLSHIIFAVDYFFL